MQPNELSLLRRKELIGTIAWVAWIVGFVTAQAARSGEDFSTFCFVVGWLAITVWVALDERSRRGGYSFWTVFALLTGPAGFALYYLTRQHVPSVCLRCGSMTPGVTSACPACGNAPMLASVRSSLAEVYSSLANSLVRGPADRTKDTAKHLAFAFGAVVILGAILAPTFLRNPLAAIWGLVFVLSVAAYWVLVAWWVYLDSAWRRMDGVTWAILTLVTNLVGLVTYLVIRGPDPRTCPRCAAAVPANLKYCPFCGSQAQTVCPRCQAPIKAEWQYCSACAAPLRFTKSPPTAPASTAQAEQEPVPDQPGVAISGSVVDVVTDSPISSAQVVVDSAAGGASATTDALGRFRIAVDVERPYVLIASAEGYMSQPKAYTPGTEESAHVRFALRQSP